MVQFQTTCDFSTKPHWVRIACRGNTIVHLSSECGEWTADTREVLDGLETDAGSGRSCHDVVSDILGMFRPHTTAYTAFSHFSTTHEGRIPKWAVVFIRERIDHAVDITQERRHNKPKPVTVDRDRLLADRLSRIFCEASGIPGVQVRVMQDRKLAIYVGSTACAWRYADVWKMSNRTPSAPWVSHSNSYNTCAICDKRVHRKTVHTQGKRHIERFWLRFDEGIAAINNALHRKRDESDGD